jgi:hypothetical protein
MSYDLQIWSVRPVDPPLSDFGATGHGGRSAPASANGHCTLSGKDWQIVVNASDRILPEDVEEEISALLPGIAYLTELNLEGRATNAALKLLRSTAKEIARHARGVVLDPQSDSITTPAGVTRFIPAKREKTFAVLTLSWWFLNDKLLTSAGRRSFLALLKRWLPEALPKRYGEYEPPQFHFAKTGLSHLEGFMAKHLSDVMVWYPNRPVTGVSVSCPKPLGPDENGFRTHHVEIEVEAAVLAQPGWAEHLRHFWRQMTFLLRPIYGEVRSEAGYSWSGGTAMFEAALIRNLYPDTTRSWFWRGVPRKLGHAVVLGKEYQQLWPEFVKQATMEKGFAFASTPDWSDRTDLVKVIGLAPKAITLLPGEGLGPKQKYPPVWPFDPPFGKR